MSGPRFNPVLAQRRCGLITQGARLDSPEVRRLDDQLREHDAACASLAAEVQAEAEAKRAAEASERQRVTEWIDRYYKRDRLTALPGRRDRIIADRLSDLAKYGKTVISRHESVTGEPVWIHREDEAS